jgi:hypothetical protein
VVYCTHPAKTGRATISLDFVEEPNAIEELDGYPT